jgi:hypothetical protein
MSKSGDHHFISQFHLRKWEATDGTILQWGRIKHNEKLIKKSVFTAATAYVPGLYSLKDVPIDQTQEIEEKVFGQIESRASPVLNQLIEGRCQLLTEIERMNWSLYLNASVLRVPSAIQRLTVTTEKHLVDSFSSNSEEFDALKSSFEEQNLLEWTKNHAPSYIANLPMETLAKLIFKPEIIERFLQFNWLVRDVSLSSNKLMIGDNPLGREGDLFSPKSLISIPLSPTHIFFGSNSTAVIENIKGKASKELVKLNNIQSLATTKKFAYGAAESSFVDRYLLRTSL